MARDGSGNYSIPNTFTPSTTIASTAVNSNFSDIATALTNSLARNSEGPMTAAIVLHQNGFNYEVDPDTGIKRTGANELAIFAGGANVVVVGTATVSIAIAVNIVGALTVGGATAFGGTQTITGSSVGFVGQEIISTEAAAAVGPIHSLYRNSASPANSDSIGGYDFYGNDSGGNKTLFGRLTVAITDVTNGSEDADFFIQAMIGGTVTTVLRSSASQIQIPGSLAVTGAFSCGAGSITSAMLTQTANAFQGAMWHAQDQKANTTTGDALTSGTWNTRTLNTEFTDDLGITLAANAFTLAAGTYEVKCEAVTYFAGSSENGGNQHVESKIRLRNTTDGSSPIIGNGMKYRANDDGGGNRQSQELCVVNTMAGRFTIAGSKTFELQNWVASNMTSTALAASIRGGVAISSGEVEVYADLKIWKVG